MCEEEMDYTLSEEIKENEEGKKTIVSLRAGEPLTAAEEDGFEIGY